MRDRHLDVGGRVLLRQLGDAAKLEHLRGRLALRDGRLGARDDGAERAEATHCELDEV